MFHSPRFIGLRKDKNTGTGGGGAAAMAKLKATLSAGSTTNAGWQKVPFTTTVLDTDSIWDNTNKRVVPKVAGYYLVSARARGATAVQAAMRIYKNGAIEEAIGEDTGSTILYATGGTGYVYCNGTTDYLEIWVFANAVAAYTVAVDETYFQVIGPLAS